MQPKNPRGRPATGQGVPVQVRIQPKLLFALDEWRLDQPEPRPTRPEAIRKAVEDWLIGQGRLPAPSDGPEGES